MVQQRAVTFTPLDPDAQLGYLLAVAAKRGERAWAGALRAEEINPRQFSMLALLIRDPEMSQAAIARRVMITPQSVSESLTVLIDQGLVARRAPPLAGRPSQLKVTSAGRALLRRAYPVVEKVNAETFAPLTAREQSSLAGLLKKLVAAE